MFRNILIPVDLTPKNEEAIRLGLEISSLHRSRITLLHVIERIEHIPDAELRGFYKKIEKNARRKMNHLVSRMSSANARVYQEILLGHRTEEIVNYAAKRKIDLIVLNSHKIDPKKGKKDLGTLSHRVALLVPCPVLLVK